MSASSADQLLVQQIAGGDEDAWAGLIARYEGRLLAYVQSRTRDVAAAEDIVQETFIGFLNSLPNYDRRRALESWLFAIAAHKLTDWLRREGRRPAVPLHGPEGDSSHWEPQGSAREASSIARSGERRRLTETALAEALRAQLDAWRRQGAWLKIKCCELLFVRGRANNAAALALGISEQAVANIKHELIAKLRTLVRRQSLPEEVFPELYAEEGI
jgi:RNA polymerase sigma-70 factor (ECF subfamily)